MHEARHAWHHISPRPSDDEDVIEWEKTVSREVHNQFDAQGGEPALLAMIAVPGMAPDEFVRPVAAVADPELLLRRRFPHLKPDQLLMARQMWTALDLNPWADEFYIQVLNTGHGPQIKLVMKIDALRLRAHRTGEYGGCDPAEYVYETNDQRFPHLCIFTVFRVVNGERRAFRGEAYWTDAFGDDKVRLSDVVYQRPKVCLSRVAEADALRKAFPEKCRGIYVEEEFKRPVTYRDAARAEPGTMTPLPSITLESPNDFPGSADGMRGRLHELGFKTAAEQRALIKRVEAKYGSCQDGMEPEFYARVIAEAR